MSAKTYVIQAIDSRGVWRDSWSTCEPTIAAGALWESTPAGWSRLRSDRRIREVNSTNEAECPMCEDRKREGLSHKNIRIVANGLTGQNVRIYDEQGRDISHLVREVTFKASPGMFNEATLTMLIDSLDVIARADKVVVTSQPVDDIDKVVS